MHTLTLRVIGTNGDGPVLGDKPFQYDVIGLPQGQTASIARNDHHWQILTTRDGVSNGWSGRFESAEDALQHLQSEQP